MIDLVTGRSPPDAADVDPDPGTYDGAWRSSLDSPVVAIIVEEANLVFNSMFNKSVAFLSCSAVTPSHTKLGLRSSRLGIFSFEPATLRCESIKPT
jgi:hypothetical protein